MTKQRLGAWAAIWIVFGAAAYGAFEAIRLTDDLLFPNPNPFPTRPSLPLPVAGDLQPAAMRAAALFPVAIPPGDAYALRVIQRFREEFGLPGYESPWYHHIGAIAVTRTARAALIAVHTSIPADPSGEALGQRLCGVFRVVLAPETESLTTTVAIYDGDQRLIANCMITMRADHTLARSDIRAIARLARH